MGDFDLSQVLDSPLDCDKGCEASCFDMADVKDELIELNEGLEMVVSCNRRTMKAVARLVMAVKRMNKSLDCGRQNLSDEELCSVIMDSLVEETIFSRVEKPCRGERTFTFVRVNSTREIRLCDSSKKDIVCAFGELQLQAITLKGGNHESKVGATVTLSKNNKVTSPGGDGQPVALSVNNNLHISCSMKDGRAVLNLEECSADGLMCISNDGNMDRFLFFRRTTGKSLHTFESAKCPGWFISTSSEEESQPVDMCTVDTRCRITSFNLT
uniref:interleukin-1 beta-like n=1 Tax=Monopterus albus TaxID=43700 RepID=UPI0009B2FBE4|nr:interleukin-1 beta-like [Monopterus albus]